MAKKVKTSQEPTEGLNRHIEQIRETLLAFQPFLSRRKVTASLEGFDEEAEEVLSETFGGASEELEAYQYAKLGESAILPEEAQEAGTHNLDRESLHQRKQVLESCLAQLELKKTARAGRDWRKTVGDRWMAAPWRSSCPRRFGVFTGRRRSRRRDGYYKSGVSVPCWSMMARATSASSRIPISAEKPSPRGWTRMPRRYLSCMSKAVVTIEDSEPLMEALTLMKKESIRHLPVTEDGTIIGVLSVGDLLRAYEKVLEL